MKLLNNIAVNERICEKIQSFVLNQVVQRVTMAPKNNTAGGDNQLQITE